MFKVLIVDDEILVRVGLKTFVPWEELGFELIGEAASGKEAIDLIRQEGCDILLTDIQMPEMNGLELLELVHVEHPQIKSVILSNHEEFKYVHKAMQLGAVDYILKLTMEPKELEQKLLGLKDKMQQARSQQTREEELRREVQAYSRAAREKRLRDIVVKHCSPGEIRSCLAELGYSHGSGKESLPFYVAKLRIGRYEEVLAENKYKSEKLLTYSVSNIMFEIMKKWSTGELIELENGSFALFSNYDPFTMLQEMNESVKRYLQLDLCLGVSAPFLEEQSIHEAYKQAELALAASFYEGVGHVICYSQDHQWTVAAGEGIEAEPLNVPHERWVRHIAQRDGRGLQQILDEWSEEIRAKRCWSPEHIKESWIQLVHHFSSLLHEWDGDIYSIPRYKDKYPYHAIRVSETLEAMQEWMSGWIPLVMDAIKDLGQRRWRIEIRTVVQIIRNKFDTALKVSELAKEVGFNEAYLSTLFKKETGETIMDMIIRLRMNKARTLLLEPGIKIYEVSEAIGYTDANYFAKLFKKIEGIHPQEYRKRYLNF